MNMKIYLTAPAEVRATRRVAQLAEKGVTADFAEVLEDINRRDWQDMHREVDPLRPAEDATIVDTTEMTFDQVVEHIIGIVKEKQA